MFTWTAPSGVIVTSAVPPLKRQLRDYPLFHVPWSYSLWVRNIWKDVR